ncbi:MAG: response regulator [Theionarchaea archaeon]|nr:response regulator [Theionarchaea archaeon]
MSNPKILYVEDDPKSRLVIKKVLENTGCQVYDAENGKEGVKLAEEMKPDIILMDIMLPVMDGLEATRQIRKIEAISKTPIIALTAKAMVTDKEQILSAGCDEYIPKPIDIPHFLETLSQYLDINLSLSSPYPLPKSSRSPASSPPSKSVLIVDDLPQTLTMLEKILTAEGYKIFSASNGLCALDVLKHHDVDLIISDILMPEMDGYRLCFEVRKNAKFNTIPFIFYSSHYSNAAEVEFGKRLGANGYLVRPLEISNLLKIIGDVLLIERRSLEPLSWEEFSRFHNNLLLSKIIEIAPEEEAFNEQKIEKMLERGHSYLIKEKTQEKSYDLFLKLLSQKYSGLCLTRSNPKFIREQYSLKKTPFIWLSNTKSDEFTSSTDLTELSLSIKDFISRAQQSIILLDGFEFLVSKMGFKVMLEFLQSINEFISNSSSILLLPLNPEIIGNQEVSMLERELTVLS